MSLQPNQIEWIENTAGLKPGKDGLLDKIAGAEADDAIKAKLLREARQALETKVGVIQVGENFNVTALSDFLKRRFTIASVSDDPNDEFDTGHDAKKLEGALPKEQYDALMVAQSVIATQSQILQSAVSPTTKKKLFTDREIADAVWEPLRRRKLIPENAVPDRYSEVVRTFDNSSKAYETRLAAYTQSLKGNEGILEGLGVAKDLFNVGGAVVSGVLADIRALDPGKIPNPTQAGQILAGVQVGISSTLNTAEALVKAHGEGKLSDPETVMAVCKEVVKGSQAIIVASFSGNDEQGRMLGKAIAAGVGMATNAVAVGVKIKQGKYEEILDDIGEMVASSFEVYAANLEYHAGKENGETTPDKQLTPKELGLLIGNSIKTSGKLIKALKDPSPEAFIEALLEGIRGGTQVGATYWSNHFQNVKLEEEAKKQDLEKLRKDNPGISDEDLDTAYDKYSKDQKSKSSFASDIIESEWTAGRSSSNDSFAGLDKKVAILMKGDPEEIAKAIKEDPQLKDLAERLAKQNEVVQEEGLAAFKEEVEQDGKDFRALLNRAETGETEADVEKIEKLIMQLKRDQMLLDMAFQISGMSAQVVATFLPQAGIAVNAIELVKNLTKAAMHFRAYGEWSDNVSDARSAMSVQMEAMTNRMDLSRGQGIEASVKALEAAAKLVGSAVSVAGPFAPAGHAVAATMGAVSAVREIIVKYYREHELAQAWKTFLKARSNPDDRKLMRKAMRTNPTLAKYAIAYGAEIEGNAIARNAMRKCGLSNDVLDSKDANVDKVVAFLEAMYPEDPVLLQPLDVPAKWHPGTIEFSAQSFSAFAGAAASIAKPALKADVAKPLLLSFTRWESDRDAYKSAYDAWQRAVADTELDTPPPGADKELEVRLHAMQDATDAVLGSVNMLIGGLKVRAPMIDAKGKPHEGMQEYLTHLMPIGVRLRQKYVREAAAMTQQAGARQPETL